MIKLNSSLKFPRILIHSLYFHPELTGISKYSGEMVEWLVKNNYQCTVVTAFPFYPYWQIQQPYKNGFYKKESSSNKMLTVYRCPLYVPAKPTGLTRILHDASFFISSFFVFIKLLFDKKYDIIISVAPPFHLGYAALFYRFFRGGKIVYHIQDLQVDMARELNMIKSPILLSVLEKLEKYIIRKVDVVSSISPGMIAKIKAKAEREILSFPNWANINNYFPITNKAEIKQEWGFKPEDKIVLYSGNIGEKQGLEQILNVAFQFKQNAAIKFIICGTGAYKEVLLNMAKQMQLTNLTFLPLQANEVFNRFLNLADLHLILQKKDASDLVMPSKLTTILAVGGLVLATANPNTSLYNEIKNNNIGILALPENDDLLYQAIENALLNQNTSIKENARKYAEKNISLDGIMQQFLFNLDLK